MKKREKREERREREKGEERRERDREKGEERRETGEKREGCCWSRAQRLSGGEKPRKSDSEAEGTKGGKRRVESWHLSGPLRWRRAFGCAPASAPRRLQSAIHGVKRLSSCGY